METADMLEKPDKDWFDLVSHFWRENILADYKQQKTQKILLKTRETEISSDFCEFSKKIVQVFAGLASDPRLK